MKTTRQLVTAAASITYGYYNARKCEITTRPATVAEVLRELDRGRVVKTEAAGSEIALDTRLGRYLVAA